MYLNIFLAIVICTISKDQAEDEGRSKSTFSLKLQPSDHTTNERGVMTSDHVIEEEPPPPPQAEERNTQEENDSAISISVPPDGGSQVQDSEQERNGKEKQGLPVWWELTNVAIAHLSHAVLMIDFEGQSQQLGFAIDSIDMGLGLCCVLVVITRVILELSLNRRLSKIAIADAAITTVCLGGIIYEAIVAEDMAQFLEAETLATDVIRTFKCFRLFLVFFEKKYYWKGVNDLLRILGTAISRILPAFCLWFTVVIIFSIMGYHIESGRILVDSRGEVDMNEGPTGSTSATPITPLSSPCSTPMTRSGTT